MARFLNGLLPHARRLMVGVGQKRENLRGILPDGRHELLLDFVADGVFLVPIQAARPGDLSDNRIFTLVQNGQCPAGSQIVAGDARKAFSPPVYG